MVKIFLPNRSATVQLGKYLAQLLKPKTVILLFGDLGAGKTTLVQGIGAGLGIKEAIVSPTFSLINEYPEGKIPLYHLDLYRLSQGEVESLGIENYWEGIEVEPGVTVIEWAERLPYLPADYLTITLTDGEAGREAKLAIAASLTENSPLLGLEEALAAMNG